MVSSSVPGSHLGRDSSSPALPRVQLRTDGGSNGSSYAFQVQGNLCSSGLVSRKVPVFEIG